jgi:plastocyanin
VAKSTLGVDPITLSETARRYEAAYAMRRPRWIRRALIAITGVVVFCLLGLVMLAYADYDMAGNGATSPGARAKWVWVQGDHLHFAVHIAQARLFDLCPCTRRVAGAQYYRAHFHALTPRQQALAANSHPRTVSEWADYFVAPFVVGLDWVHDGVTWLGGQRPSQEAIVIMDLYEFQPAEVDIARGTTVTWRNVDELGEAHTVTAYPGQLVKFDSGFLEPDESFSYTFTERGRFTYYSVDAGQPGQPGMSGVVVVR